MNVSIGCFRRKLLRWYDRARRDLPWRLRLNEAGSLDPYHVLVSEAMLQQTQVATVIPYFQRFIARFPDFQTLAEAGEQEVLRLWQGLGYYSRARNLQGAARRVVGDYAGQLPQTTEELLKLPGVGRYTAGAVASIAFGRRAPILDGNVARVLCRLDAIETNPREPATQERLWERAEEILPRSRIGDFNSALMELGALVCTPRNPRCLTCPVQECCAAFATGIQEKIPPPRRAKPTPLFRRRTFCIQNGNRWLIEQRPEKGRWAGMWQFITVDAEAEGGAPTWLEPGPTTRLGTVTHSLTHRRYEFEVYVCSSGNPADIIEHPSRKWVTLEEVLKYPLPRPHSKIVEMLQRANQLAAAT